MIPEALAPTKYAAKATLLFCLTVKSVSAGIRCAGGLRLWRGYATFWAAGVSGRSGPSDALWPTYATARNSYDDNLAGRPIWETHTHGDVGRAHVGRAAHVGRPAPPSAPPSTV